MTTPTSSDDLRVILSRVIVIFIGWIPIVVGLVYQFLMYFFQFQCIYVVLTPPEYICPFVTLETEWWLLLAVSTGIFCTLAYLRRIRPPRLFYPFYLYLIYLLIFVKPL